MYPVRDKLLDRAQLRPDDTVLDVGAGDGLVAFGAPERLAPDGHVIFSDISQDLLDHCRKAAEAEGVPCTCRLLLSPADQLSAVVTGSVDVVTTRSVLIYVKDKAGALREFYRVLEPGPWTVNRAIPGKLKEARRAQAAFQAISLGRAAVSGRRTRCRAGPLLLPA